MIGPASSIGELVRLLVKEGQKRLLTVSALFSVMALVGLTVGLNLPKRWDASAVVRVEESNIIKPLMEGRAVTTAVTDEVAVVTQVVLSKKILREILEYGGWVHPSPAPQPPPREEEQMLSKLRGRIKIDSPRDGLIRISYHDEQQQRSAKIANKLAEIYVREANEAKERESREAFDFIDSQVKEYGDKLAEAQDKVLAYYRGEENPPPPSTDNKPARPHGSSEQLAELRAEEATLTAQLAKAAPKSVDTPDLKQSVDRARNHVIDLQGQLDRMLVSYTDEHPDVRRLKRELAAVQDDLDRAEKAATERHKAAAVASALDDKMNDAARARLDEVKRKIAAITGVPVRQHRSPDATLTAELKVDPEMKGVGHDTKLSELLRRYEATRDIYQDLLKRRENARVSMMLDAERRGLTLRIQEAAEVPVIPSSLRLMHITLIALFLAMLMPLGLLFAIVALDKRVRSSEQIMRMARVPLLVSINYAPPQKDKTRHSRRGLWAVLMVVAVFAVYGIVFIIKLKTT